MIIFLVMISTVANIHRRHGRALKITYTKPKPVSDSSYSDSVQQFIANFAINLKLCLVIKRRPGILKSISMFHVLEDFIHFLYGFLCQASSCETGDREKVFNHIFGHVI